MNYRILGLALLSLHAALQCRTQALAPVSGNIRLHPDWKPVVYLIEPGGFAQVASNFSGRVLDSAQIDASGHFAFTRMPAANGPALLQICVQRKDSRFPNRLTDEDPLLANYMPLIWQTGENLHVSAEIERFQASFSLRNASAENADLLTLRDLRHRAFSQERAWLAAGAPGEEQLLAYEAALGRFRQPLMDFADSSAHLLPALVAVRWVSPSGDYERVPELLARQCDKWSSQAPEHPWTGQLCQAAGREKLPVLTGDILPEFQLPLSTGDTVSLHRLLGRRLTIVDVWASWCHPCRVENRDVLQPLYERYENAGLQIVAYSIDASPTAWRAAIARDGARWPHASHLTGDAAPLLDTLRIRTIPANFIVDDKGKILAKNLHGEALTRFVTDFLK